jgi:hypothetical protein
MRSCFSRFLGLCVLVAVDGACTTSDSSPGRGSGGAAPGTGGEGGATAGVAGAGGSAGTGGQRMDGGSGGSGTLSDGGDAAVDSLLDGGGAGDAAIIVDAGDGGSTQHVAVPSAGCGKPNPAHGARTIVTGGMTGTFNVNLPAAYDTNAPMPLGFAFHGYGNPACGPTGGECQGFAQLPAITVFMKSFTAGWEGQPQPLAQNLQFYEDVLALMKNESCVDLTRIFIAGVSSGGQFIEHIACNDGPSLWQVTAVSAYVDKGADTKCKGTPPVLVTQGVTETTVDIDTPIMFAKRNGCSATPPAGLDAAKADMMAAFQMGKAEYRCLDWDGCTTAPVRYCISSQMTYGGLTHGWPKVGGTLIADFQSTLE